MRLRDISDQIRDILETDWETIFSGEVSNALVQDIAEVQTVYRPVAPVARKDSLLPWLAFSFVPFKGLIEPFNIYPGRFWALLRMHRQPSGMPELITHINRELPGASSPIVPDLYTSFSYSSRVQTIIKRVGKDPATLRFFHKPSLMESDRTTLAAEFCLPGLEGALPEGDVEDGIPGLVSGPDGGRLIYLGDLVFYNQFRTADRGHLRGLVLNCVAVAVVTRYVRDIVRKSIAAEEAG